MRVVHHHQYTLEQYLIVEHDSQIKHEYFEGEIFAMTGGTPGHSALAMNIGVSLGSQLKGKPCQVYNADLRIGVQASGLYTYPDLSVVCGKSELDPVVPNTVVNPVVVVEVLSPSTEAYDRGQKFENYRRIPTLKEYVLASQRERLVEVFRRGEKDEWLRTETRGGRSARLESIGCTLDVDEIYAGIQLQQAG